ncbi:MAG: tyrosine recombinase XerC [Bacteroidales bacterium]|nr:tyrosine recombinase XerC [Bacteroidales bacterium]
MSYEDFIDYLKYEKRVSPHTVTAYENDMSQFFSFLEEKLEINQLQDVHTEDIRTWIISLLEDESLQAKSVNRKISAVRAFYRYKLKIKELKVNPTLSIHAPKIPKKLPQYVDQKDMEHLFADIPFEESFEGLRDRTILELFYATGMRLSELLNIKVQDIHLQENTVKVLGKRNKERVIPFGNRLEELLTLYLENLQKKFCEGTENNYIFVTANGKQLYPKAVYRIVRKYLDMVTTIDKRSPHVIRHTFATHLLNKGADLNAIKTILGHSSLAATQVYTHNSIEQLKSIYKQAHPRA